APSTTLFAADDNTVPAQSVTDYDGQGRVTGTAFNSDAVTQWTTSTAYPAVDEKDTTPAAGGTPTTTFADAQGRLSASYAYTTATPTRNANDAEVTTYTYTPTGQQATVADAGRTWTYTYDLLGRKTSQSDPSAGTTTYGYDAAGNLTSTVDGRN